MKTDSIKITSNNSWFDENNFITGTQGIINRYFGLYGEFTDDISNN